MDVFKACLEEISLSGLEGCTLGELWFHLETHKPALALSLDDAMKSYLWGLIVNIARSSMATSAVSMFRLPSPRDPPTTEPLHGLIHTFKYRYLSKTEDGVAVRGSCENYDQRTNVTMEISTERPGLAAVEERYGHSLVMVCQQELRERALLPRGMSPVLELPPVQYGLLEVVGQARHRGILRPFVTSKYLKIDARCTFFYAKQLEKKGLIFIKNIHTAAYDNRTVAALYLVSYRPILPPDLPDIRAQICSMLSTMPYQTRLLKEIYSDIGKKFKTIKKDLTENGHIEMIQMKEVAEEYAANPDIAHLNGCRLLTPWVPKEPPCEDEDEESGGSELKTPVVAELPLETQGYRLIESKGPEGIAQSAFSARTGLDLSNYTNRGISKNLIKKSKVVAITNEEIAIRTIRLVAAPHVESNTAYQQLQAEAVRTGSEKHLPIMSGPSYFPPDDRRKKKKKMLVKEEAPVISPVGEQSMTEVADSLIAQLEASIKDSQKLDSGPALSDPVPASPKPADSTQKSRFSVKTPSQLKRTRIILEFFKEHGVLKNLYILVNHVRKVELQEGKEAVMDSKTLNKTVAGLISAGKLCKQEVVLSSDDIDHTLDMPTLTQTITLRYLPTATKEELAAAKEASLSSFKATVFKKHARSQPKAKKEKQVVEADDSADEEMVDIPDNGSSAKFQRLRHFHCYLWLLSYGQGNDETSALSKVNFPWASLVSQLPVSSRGSGWLLFNDIVHNLPFSLYLLLVRIAIGKVPARFLHYFQDPDVINNTLLCQLPAPVKRALTGRMNMVRRELTVIMNFLYILEDLRLVRVEGHNHPRDRSQVYVQLLHEANIIDTSTCAPRRSFFLNEARPQFKQLGLRLTSVANVERYWFDLQTVCQKTPIVLVERRDQGEEPRTPRGLNDPNALIYCRSRLNKASSEVIKEYNSRGFGAGGLPPLMFSHASRNWGRVYNPYHRRVKRELPERAAPPAKKRKLVKVPAAQVTRNGGGRGRERNRVKKAVKTARKVRQLAYTQRYKFFSELSRVIQDDTGKSRGGGSKPLDTRTYWSTEQSNFVFTCYLACCLLHQKGGPRVTYTQMRDSIVRQFPSQRRLSNNAVKRYLNIILRKKTPVKNNLEIRMTECLNELESGLLGSDEPDITYEGILDFILKRSKSGRHLVSPVLLLPATAPELDIKYTIIGAPKPVRSRVLPVVVDEGEVNQALIADLIIATLCAPETSYDQYTTFKVFESFPEMDVKSTFELFRRLQLIKRKRTKPGVPAIQSPLNTQSYSITHSFFVKLIGHYSPRLMGDMSHFLSYLSGGVSGPAPWSGVKRFPYGLEIHGDKTPSTAAASLLEAATLPNVIDNIKSVVPAKLFQDLASQDDWEDEASEMRAEDLDGQSDGEEESRDESDKLMRKLRNLRGGVSVLFGVGQGTMNFGHIEVQPAVGFKELFEHAQFGQDGLPEQSTEKMDIDMTPKENFWQSISEPTVVRKMSLEQFLKVAEAHLQFDVEDLSYAGTLYQFINNAGSAGVQRSNLSNNPALSDLPTSHDLDGHIQAMLNFNAIFIVGVTEELLVSAEHSGRWSMSSDPAHHHTPYRPWSTVSAPHINTDLAEQYQHGVLTHIMAHPGITLLDLHEFFYPTLRLNALRDVLQVLELSHQIQSYKMAATGHCSLFDTPELSTEEMVYFEPVASLPH